MKKALFLVVLLCLGTAYAADTYVAFREMDVNIGARAQGVGNAFTAMADDSTSVFWNAAGLSKVKYTEASLSYNSWFVDTSIQYLTGAMNTGKNSGAGAGLVFINMGEIDFIDDTGLISGTTLRPFSLILSAGYGTAVFDYYSDIMKSKPDMSLSLGVSGKIILNSDGEDLSHGALLDIGAIMDIGDRVKAAINLKNLGAVSYGMSPIAAIAGGCFKVLSDDVNEALLAAEARYGIDGVLELALGAEYSFASSFFARAGYEWQSNYQTSAGTIAGLNAGVGVKLQAFTLDYTISFNGGLGTSHAVTLKYLMR